MSHPKLELLWNIWEPAQVPVAEAEKCLGVSPPSLLQLPRRYPIGAINGEMLGDQSVWGDQGVPSRSPLLRALSLTNIRYGYTYITTRQAGHRVCHPVTNTVIPIDLPQSRNIPQTEIDFLLDYERNTMDRALVNDYVVRVRDIAVPGDLDDFIYRNNMHHDSIERMAIIGSMDNLMRFQWDTLGPNHESYRGIRTILVPDCPLIAVTNLGLLAIDGPHIRFTGGTGEGAPLTTFQYRYAFALDIVEAVTF